ncbi:zinc-binding dehydrogenase [Devosia sp. FKR38]|uniref:zinc-binding dehydrogenase n=1 Tax=Devosia sp. FKR38 TaxID=2562312 RepID=UPI0010BF74CE|nr:zinc-binding dehydrogenase [Devosia sp. FKR38]
MRAAIYENFGNPSEVTKLGDVAQPNPGKGEVRIRTILSPIHNHDLWTTRGSYGYKPTLPAIGGTEAVGTVDAVGEGVDAALVGQRVAVAGINGTWAEFFVAPAAGLVPLPAAIADEAAAQLIAMPFSAISLLDLLKAKAGDWIVQTAANGAVGKVLAALTAERGIGLINLVRREEAVAELTELGMTHVIATSNANWIEQVKAITGPKGAVSAVDSVGGEVGASLIDVLGSDGELVIFGTATGAPMPLNSGAVIFKEITIKGFWGAKVSAAMSGEKKGQLFGELITLAVQGKLPLPVGGVFDLADAGKAMDAAQIPGRPGKILLRA